MNVVTLLCYNTTDKQLELTKNAITSVLNQTIPTHLLVVDNGSTQPTGEWLNTLPIEYPERVSIIRNEVNQPPVKVSNKVLELMFETKGYDYVLGMPNDVILPPNFYEQCLRWPRGIVTASMTEDIHFPVVEEAKAVSECTPLCVALIRSWAYQALMDKDGFFLDPRYDLYASDCDWALRLAACGIRGIQLDLPYWHYGSASHRLAAPGVGKGITNQADEDRRRFEAKWGFSVTDERYGQSCGDINFRGVGQG